ncbi:MAG: 2-phospho-L-lactate transferase [Asgard group archaeon]|nr:2-phospho-L-lactate transferase [Asgard group archaeon]
MSDKKKITFLSGGTGTPKLLLGFKEIIPEEQMVIIGNIGDDDEFYGLLVSPDIDTLIYLFSHQLDLNKFWGVKDETFANLKQLSHLGEDTWFHLGDKDLALHLLRNKLLISGKNYSEVIFEISKRLKIKARILPFSNDNVRTKMITNSNECLSFQDYTVKHKENVVIKSVLYEGSKKAKINVEVKEELLNSSAIIIGPSNPITSIGPMLAVKQLNETLCATKAKVIAVSPIAGDQAFSGPVIRLMKELNKIPNAFGIAEIYRKFLDTIFISESDENLTNKIEKIGINVICTNISLKTTEERIHLAKRILQEIKN